MTLKVALTVKQGTHHPITIPKVLTKSDSKQLSGAELTNGHIG